MTDLLYTIRLTRDPSSEAYTATVDELRGLVTESDGVPATLARLGSALTSWVEAAVASGYEPPEPRGRRCDGCAHLSRYSATHATCPVRVDCPPDDGFCECWSPRE